MASDDGPNFAAYERLHRDLIENIDRLGILIKRYAAGDRAVLVERDALSEQVRRQSRMVGRLRRRLARVGRSPDR